jgi:hypothetical protein
MPIEGMFLESNESGSLKGSGIADRFAFREDVAKNLSRFD